MTFDELCKLPGTQVVLFYGIGCAPCTALKPVLRAALEAVGKGDPVLLNVASELPAARTLGIRTVPTVVAIEGGRPRVLFSGAKTAEQLVAIVKELA
jgi:Thioredoxin domain-containing protein